MIAFMAVGAHCSIRSAIRSCARPTRCCTCPRCGARAVSARASALGRRACRSPTGRRCIRARSATRPRRRSACTSAARCMIAAGALWLRPRAPLAWLTLLYPPLVFVVILGTGNHYVLDTLVGTACVAAGFAAAHAIHGPLPRGSRERRLGTRRARGNRLRAARVPHQWRLHRRTRMSVRTVLSHTRHPHSAGRARTTESPRGTSGCASSGSSSPGCSSTSACAPRPATTPRRRGPRALPRPSRADPRDRARGRPAGALISPPRARHARELGLHLGPLAADRGQRRVALPPPARGVPPDAHGDLRLGRDRHDHLPRLPRRAAAPDRRSA